MANDGKLTNRIVSIELGSDPSQSSTVTFGNSSASTVSNFTYAYPTATNSSWSLPVSNIFLNGTKITNSTFITGLIDSTESSILLSPSEYAFFKANVTSVFPKLICSEQ